MTFTAALHPLAPRADVGLFQAWSMLASEAKPYLRPDFFALELPLVEADETFVAVAHRDDKIAGALPLMRRGRTLEALRSAHAPEFDYVGDPEALPAIWRALAADPRWDVLVLGGVPAGSPLAVGIPGAALPDLAVTAIRPGERSPYFALPGFEGRLPHKHAQNLRRCVRHLGELELERVTTFSHSALEAGFTIEGSGWKAAAASCISSRAELRHFYHAVARLAARRGELALYFLRQAGRPIAFLFALEDDRTLYALKIGVDPAVEHSPGHVLILEVARNAERRGLLELDLLGVADEWKLRWTHLAHDHVLVVVYRPTLRGAAVMLARELVKPRLSPETRDTVTRCREELTRRHRRCQMNDVIGVHTRARHVMDRLRRGIGIRSGLRSVLRPPGGGQRLGAASRFHTGEWVRVLDEAQVRATLGPGDKLRGLTFVPAQFTTCGHVYRVHKKVRRIMDDEGRLRPVSGTVLLEGVTCDCGGDKLGCGRHCPLFYRDEWLEKAAPPPDAVAEAGEGPWVTVKSVAEIRATLDDRGQRDGVTFLREMGRFSGQRRRVVRRVERVHELGHWTATRGEVYLLEGAHCAGTVLGDLGPCDRACALRWHADWLSF